MANQGVPLLISSTAVPRMNKASRLAVLPLLVLSVCACSRKDAGASAAQPDAKPAAASRPLISGERALQYTQQVVGFGPRYVGSSGHARTESYLRSQLK